MNTTRLRELCDAVENGARTEREDLENRRELIKLAREAIRRIDDADAVIRSIADQADTRQDLIEYADSYFLRNA